MSKASDIHKRRLARRGKTKKRSRARLPKHFYYELKALVRTAEFASLVAEFDCAKRAILSSDWFAEVRLHKNFKASRQLRIWIQRAVKSWRTQQIKQARSEWIGSKAKSLFHVQTPKSDPPKKQKLGSSKPRQIQRLNRNDEVYVACTNSLSPAIAHQKLLMRYDAASGSDREQLARRVEKKRILVRAIVFIGKIRNNLFTESTERFDWKTDFKGALFEVEFAAEGFKSAWKARLISTGNCNTVKGWRKHHLHRKSRMPVRFQNLIAERFKEVGKSHLIRDLGLARLAA